MAVSLQVTELCKIKFIEQCQCQAGSQYASLKEGERSACTLKTAVLFRGENAKNVKFLPVPQSSWHFPVLFRLF